MLLLKIQKRWNLSFHAKLVQSLQRCQDHNEIFHVTATIRVLHRINYQEVKCMGHVSLEISNQDVCW